MKKRALWSKIIFVAILPLILGSCTENYDINFDNISDSLGISSSLAVPVAYGSVTLEEFLPEPDSETGQYLFVDEDKLLHLQYNTALDTFEVNEMLGELPGQDTTVNWKASESCTGTDQICVGAFNDPLQTVILEKTTNYHFISSNPDQSVDSITMKSGNLLVEVWSDFPYDGTFDINFPTIKTKTGEVFTINTNIQSNGDKYSIPFDLAGMNIGLLYQGEPNRLVSEISINLKNNGQPVIAGQSLYIRLKLDNLSLESFVGRVGQINYNIPFQSINVGLTEILSDGELGIADPKIRIITKNYFGIPISLQLQNFYFYETSDGTGLPVTGSAIDNPFIIHAPTIDEYGEFKIDTLLLDKTTTNLPDLLSKPIDHITLGGVFGTNPEDVSRLNFVGAGHTFSANIDLDIPLDLRLANLQMNDTSEFKIGDIVPENGIDLTDVSLQLAIHNGFPIEADLQIYFLNENNVKIDSAFENRFQLQSGTTQNGRVTASTETKTAISLTKARFEKLKDATNMILNATFQTEGAETNQTVKIYSDYTLGVNVAVSASANLTSGGK